MKKGISVIIAAVAVVAVILGTFSVRNNLKSTKEFVADGYILNPSKEEMVTNNVDQQFYFSQGDKYKEKFGTQILFNDHDGKEANISKEHFIHYSDGSLGSFTKGVLLDVSDLDQSNYAYYSLTKKTILVKNGNSYELSTKGESLSLSEYVWKISDTDYMLVSPTVTLKIGNQMIDFADYAQISYVDNGIVRISHVTGTYQTISAESRLITETGKELNLVGKSFMAGDGSVISLNDLALNDDSYIKADENVDDKYHVPTFNVINGKDGANGTNGKEGSDGDDGEDGDEGEEGEEGQEGQEGQEGEAGIEGEAGLEGLIGLEGEDGLEGLIGEDGKKGSVGKEGAEGLVGYDGDDGVEGQSGPMGYDGAAGLPGEDASNANNDASTLAPAELNMKPIVSMISDSTAESAGQEYKVNSGSATMTLQLEDPNDGGSLATGSTKVFLYDKETMAPLFGDEKAKEYGSLLEQSPNGASLNFTGLDPNKEYLLVVKGDYDVTDGYTINDATLFTKVFKTDELGVSIAKLDVTDTKISVVTSATDERLTSYSFRIYDKSVSDGTKREIITGTVRAEGAKGCAGVTVTINGNELTFVSDETYPSVINVDKTAHFDEAPNDDVMSDHRYYAEICDVVCENQLVNSGDTEIELYTLKRQPYDKAAHVADSNVYRPVTQMSPELMANEKSRTLTLSLGDLVDEDYGIKEYRYELYSYQDIVTEDNKIDFSMASPKYSKTTLEPTNQSFAIPDNDVSMYVGRVVVLFNDNSKDVELCSLESEPKGIVSTTNDLMVEIVNINASITADENSTAHHDVIQGAIKVTDPGSIKKLIFNSDNTIRLYASNRYNDLDMQEFKFDDNNIIKESDDVYLIPFTFDGLRAKEIHTLTVYGSVDTDGDGKVSDVEKNTYLTGKRIETVAPTKLAAIGAKVTDQKAAFAIKFNIAAALGDDGANKVSDDVALSYAKYETKVMDSISFSLWHITPGENGQDIIEKLGTTTMVNDDNSAKKDSTYQNTFIEREKHGDDIFITRYSIDGSNSDASMREIGGLEIDAEKTKSSNTYVLTPSAFGIDDNDSRLFAGGYFKIQVDDAQDYTTFNSIPFKEGENFVAFAIQKKHVQATKPYEQVDVVLLNNDSAKGTDGYQPNIDDDTVVGIRLYARYPYTDIKKIKYHIYEINDRCTLTPEELETADIFAYSEYVTEVLYAEKTVGEQRNYKSGYVDYYFNNRGGTTGVEWHSVSGADVDTVIKRGHRYIVSYEVTDIADHEKMECHLLNEQYPYCAHDTVENTPLYRSQVIELDKQKPSVERYPYTSEKDKVTWMYRFIDPDEALIKNADNQVVIECTQYADLSKFDSENPVAGAVPYSVVETGSTWNAVQFNVNDNRYYTTQVKYKVNELANEETIVSEPVKKYPIVSANNIKAKGTDTTQAVVSEGGYRYSLTLVGADVPKYAAVQLTVTECDSSGDVSEGAKKVIYDPILIDSYNTVKINSVDVPYVVLKFDASKLQELVDATKLYGSYGKISLVGYYNTQVSGFSGYEAIKDIKSNKSLDGENIFAIRAINKGSFVDNVKYIRYDEVDNNKTMDNAPTGTSYNSIFIPGLDNGDNKLGLNITSVDNRSSVANMLQRFPVSHADSISDDREWDYSINGMTFDETGLYDASTNAFYSVEKIDRYSISFEDGDKSNILVLNQMMPAVEKVGEIKTGGTTANIKVKIVGNIDQITDDNKKVGIYAYLLDANGQFIRVEQISETIENETKYYYKPVEVDGSATGTVDDYKYSDFKNFAIPLMPNQTDNIADLNIRGLQLGTDYSVVYFAYDKTDSHEPVLLYSLDGKEAGYKYFFRTAREVTIDIGVSDFIINDYGNKYMHVTYGISDGENTGVLLYWKEEGSTEFHLLAPKGTDVKYYSPEPANNTPFDVNANPSTGAWLYDTNKKVTIYAFEDSITKPTFGDIDKALGHVDINKNVSSEEPVFIPVPIQNTQTPGEEKIGIDLTYTDYKREVINGSYTVIFKSEDGTIVGTYNGTIDAHAGNKTIEVSAPNASGKYTAIVTADVDRNNNGAKDATITAQTIIEVSKVPSASTITGSASSATKALTMTFGGLQNFDSVNSISMTVYNKSKKEVALYCDLVQGTGWDIDARGNIVINQELTKAVSYGDDVYVSIQYNHVDENGSQPLGAQQSTISVL